MHGGFLCFVACFLRGKAEIPPASLKRKNGQPHTSKFVDKIDGPKRSKVPSLFVGLLLIVGIPVMVWGSALLLQNSTPEGSSGGSSRATRCC